MNAKKFVNLSKFLLAGALVLGMTACSSDDEVANGGTDNKVNTYLTVSITGNSLQRTANTGATTTNGSTAENTISSLKVILVKSGIVANTFDVAGTSLITTSETGNTVETAGKETKPIKVATGTYRVYVIANPSNKFSVSLSMTEDQLRKIISSQLATSDYATDNNFLMTNATNYKDDNTEAKLVTVNAQNTENNPAKTEAIHLDRLAAKILISNTTYSFNKVAGSDFSLIHYTTGGARADQQIDINLVNYSLINTYNKANLYQQWDGASTDGFKEELLTPNYSSSYDYFANATTDFGNQKDVFSTRTAAAANTIAGFSELTDIKNVSTGLTTASYCLENNPYNTIVNGTKYTKYDTQVTGVLFKAQAVQHGTTTSQTFYSYNGKYYLELADIQKEYPEVFAKYFNGTGVVSSAQTTLTGQLSEATSVTPTTSLRVKYGVKVYDNGNMYYTYYIKDKNYLETQGTGSDNYYAIMRNSIYSLTVNNLLRIGDDIPFGWTSNPIAGTQYPIDSDEAYMTVELAVNQWVLNAYPIDLK